MAGRRTNLALLVLLAASLGTGALAFGIGSGWVVWAVVAHGALGLGILVLAPWKSAIARRGLRRAREGRWASMAFAALSAVTVLSGIGHSSGWIRSVGPVTAMQVHVTAAILLIPLAAWHVAVRRVRWRRTDLSRRNLLRAGALAAGSVAAYGGLAGVVWATGSPGRDRRSTGSYQRGSFAPAAMPTTQWLDDRIPSVDAAVWRLDVGATGRGPGLYSLDQLERWREPVTATLDCTGGWFATQRWEGVRLDRLVVGASGRSVVVRSVTGYARRFPASDVSHLWVVTHAGGEPLSAGHGFPARLVAPGRRGFWWVKWIATIRVEDTPWWWQPPFPLT